MYSNKKLYIYNEENGDYTQTLSLTDEQAAVFKWFKHRGFNVDIEEIENNAPEDIKADDWL